MKKKNLPDAPVTEIKEGYLYFSFCGHSMDLILIHYASSF